MIKVIETLFFSACKLTYILQLLKEKGLSLLKRTVQDKRLSCAVFMSFIKNEEEDYNES